MTEAKQLPAEIQTRMDELLGSAGEVAHGGDFPKSIELSLQAWSLMPEPKHQWDFYPQTLAAGLIDDYVAVGDADSARAWIESAYKMYDDTDRRNHYVLMMEGAALYKLGLLNDAYAVFDRIYQIFGKAGFKGEEKAYLDFYLNMRKSK